MEPTNRGKNWIMAEQGGLTISETPEIEVPRSGPGTSGTVFQMTPVECSSEGGQSDDRDGSQHDCS